MTHRHELPPNPPNMYPDLPAKDATRAALFAAIVGTPDERPHGFASWLHSGIHDLKGRGPAPGDDDPDAFHTMIGEMEQLLRLLDRLTDNEHDVPERITWSASSTVCPTYAIDEDLPW